MNRILFEHDEIVNGEVTFGGERAEHVLNVLHGEVGQILKTGEIDGPVGTSEIVAISPTSITVCCDHQAESIRPWIDLILAPPRPRVMKRLLPQLATLGVGRVFLVGAKKVEKDFWGATLLKPENYRPLLIDGLMQAGSSILPLLETRRNLRKFVNEELDALYSNAGKFVAHPYEVPRAECSVPRAGCGETSRPFALSTKHQALSAPLLAIGPEGGWTDEEVALFEAHGFVRYSLGARILRTDTATIALLAQLMKEYDKC